MSQLSVTPWRDWDEWEEARRGLFDKDAGARRRGLGLVAMWQSRERLPIAVESTAMLVGGCLSAEEAAAMDPARDLTARPAAVSSLALAIIRLVNGFADRAQTGMSAKPILVLARSMGLSEGLVSIRHAATHGELPSLASLLSASACAMEWLENVYWEPVKSYLMQMRHTFAILLTRYRSAHQKSSLPKQAAVTMHILERLESPSEVGLFAELLAKELLATVNASTRACWTALLDALEERDISCGLLQLSLFLKLAQAPTSQEAGVWIQRLVTAANVAGVARQWPLALALPAAAASPQSPLAALIMGLLRVSSSNTSCGLLSHPEKEDEESDLRFQRVTRHSFPHAFTCRPLPPSTHVVVALRRSPPKRTTRSSSQEALTPVSPAVADDAATAAAVSIAQAKPNQARPKASAMASSPSPPPPSAATTPAVGPKRIRLL